MPYRDAVVCGGHESLFSKSALKVARRKEGRGLLQKKNEHDAHQIVIWLPLERDEDFHVIFVDRQTPTGIADRAR